jgi:hypothetical protein
MQSDDPQYLEIELLEKIAQGDRQSFSELYDRFVRVLFSTAMIVTRQREIAEGSRSGCVCSDLEKGVSLQPGAWQTAHVGDRAHTKSGDRPDARSSKAESRDGRDKRGTARLRTG